MFQLLALLCFCCSSLLVVSEIYNGNGAYPGGAPGSGLYPGDPGYRGRGGNGDGFHDALPFCVPSAEDPDADCIPGEAGLNYPVFSQVPPTGFACQDHQFPGYYADQEAQCQVFHICQHDDRHDSFLCPNGTVFNQQYFVCDWWYNFDCATASSFYGLNADLYQEPGFYGGAYSPRGQAFHHADPALPDGFGAHRSPPAHLENGGLYPNGYSSGLAGVNGRDPLAKPKLINGAAALAKGY